jgi:hypothetical protein
MLANNSGIQNLTRFNEQRGIPSGREDSLNKGVMKRPSSNV